MNEPHIDDGEKDALEIGVLGEKAELLSFYQEFHERGERINTLYHWRQTENTVMGEVVDYVVRHNGRVVGAMGINAAVHACRGEKIVLHWHRDTLISPSMRGRGLVTKLLKTASADFDMVLAKGSNAIMYKTRKKHGWQDAPKSDYMALPLQRWPGDRNLKTKIVQLLLFYWGRIFLRKYSKESGISTEIGRFDDGFDALAQRSLQSNAFSIYKTSAYLNWRYFNCPGKTYKVLSLIDGENRGGIVIRLPNDPHGEAWIVDILCELSRKEMIKQLVADALHVIKKSGAGKVLVFATSSVVRNILVRFGFVNIKRSPRFTYIAKPGHQLEGRLNGVEWNFWHGDSDNEIYE